MKLINKCAFIDSAIICAHACVAGAKKQRKALGHSVGGFS